MVLSSFGKHSVHLTVGSMSPQSVSFWMARWADILTKCGVPLTVASREVGRGSRVRRSRASVRTAMITTLVLGTPLPRYPIPPPMTPPPMAPPPMTPSPAGPPCQGTRIGTLCFSAVSPKSLSFGELDDYCANVGMKVPGLAEYRYAMPRAPAGLFPPGASIWMAEAFQYNRNHEEYGSVVVWYSPGSWNSGPVSATAKLPVVCVDRLLTSRTDSGKSYYVGVPKQRVNQLVTTTTQQDAYWCWAAVAQMIWMLRGKVVTQQDPLAQLHQ